MKQVKFTMPLRMLAVVFGLILSASAFAQQITVNGHVKDDFGDPVIGATVRVDGTQTMAVTDLDGNFTLQANQGADLTVTYIGFADAKAKAAPTVVITMGEDAQLLEQVVVIGYGRAKKNDLTGSVTAIKPDELSHGLQTSADDMLAGKVAGLNITSEGGAPGAGSKIRIRGGSSLNASNDPLYVIDGLQMDPAGIGGMNPLSSINPNDIESFTVLKSASATAIYGSRASNGVIIITTKKGKAGQKAKVSYNGNVSVAKALKTVDVFNGPEFVEMIKQVYGENSDAYAALGYYDENGVQHFANTDWQDEIYRTAVSTDHNITITGGTANMPYRLSMGFTNQPGIEKSTMYRRYTGSFNVAPVFLNDHLRFNVTGKAMYAKRKWDNGAINSAVLFDPTKPVRLNQDIYNQYFGGYFQWYQTANFTDDRQWLYQKNTNATANPVAQINYNGLNNFAKTFTGNVDVDYAIHGFEDLHLRATLAGNLTLATAKENQSPYSTNNYYYGYHKWEKKTHYNNLFNITAQYTKELKEDVHYVDAIIGYEWQRYRTVSDWYGFGIYPSTSPYAGQRHDEPGTITLYKTENRLRSYFGRLNYTLLNRYLLTFTMRADGSSRFDKGNEWGYFPSAAFAWRIKEEAFLRDNQTISDLKLRLDYGITGQQNGIDDFYYLPVYTNNYDHAYYPLFGNGATARPEGYNTDLTWEKTTTYNVGLDLSLWNDRVVFNADWYYRKTKDLISDIYVPAGSNFEQRIKGNIGSLHNTGVEFMATVRPVVKKNWNWEVTYNVTYNKNKIDELASDIIMHGDGVGSIGAKAQAYCVGHSVSAFYVYKQVYDQNGKIIPGQFVDRNGNGYIDTDDRYFYYKADPDVTMGLGSKLTYKNWDFSFNTRAQFGNHVFNHITEGMSNTGTSGWSWQLQYLSNKVKDALKYGITENNDRQAQSDCWIQNASFFKLDNVTLGYSFKKFLGNNITGRVYVTAQNVLTITNYDGLDPEIQSGVEGSFYPRPFQTIVGINLNF